MSTKSLFGSRGKKTASLLLAVSLFLTSFSSLSFAEVLTNADGLVTNLQTSGSAYLSASGVGEASGGFSYQFDLSLPKGRTNLTPEISIQYQNQSASDQQIFGYGFSLSIPFVERTNKYGSEKMFDPAYETFRSSLAGELVQDGSVYRAKNEFGDFVSLSRNGNEWIGTTKDGLTYRFGSDGFSQQSDPNDSSRISRWYLSSITDPNNNVVSYQYTEGTGVVYPASISYGGRYSITFATETAPVHSSYELGFLSERDQRINSVSVFDLSNEILRYNFVFSTGVNTRRDLLQSITAVDTISSVSLPPVTFTYAGDTLPAWIHDNSVDFPEPLNQSDNGVRFGDLNGDGLTDMVRYHWYDDNNPSNSFTIRRVHLNEGDGNWDINATWNWGAVDTPFYHEIDQSGGNPNKKYTLPVFLIDVNGDGLADLVDALGCEDECHYADPGYDGTEKGVYLNTGSGFVKDSGWNLPNFATWNQDHNFLRNEARRLVDVNADGLPDIVTSYFNGDENGSPNLNITSSVQLNTGAGWATSSLSFPAAFAHKSFGTPPKRSFSDVGTRLADVNGDGLVDVLRSYENDQVFDPELDEQSVYLNTGSGWELSTAWGSPPLFMRRGQGTANHLVDINGDRLPEIVNSMIEPDNERGYTIRVNDGDGWFVGGSASAVLPASVSYPHPPFALNYSTGIVMYSNSAAMLDFDGDTMQDAWNLKYSTSGATQASGGSVYLNASEIPDSVVNITDSQGGTTTISYDGYLATVQSTLSDVGSSQVNPVVVTEHTTDNGFGNVVSEMYEYKLADYYATSSDIRDRRFAGFGQVTKTTDLNKETTWYHQGNGNDTASGEAGDTEALIGQVYRTEITDLSDNLYTHTQTDFDTYDLGNDSTFVKRTSQVTLDYDGDGDEKAAATSYTYSNTHGSVLTITEHGEVNASSDGTWSDTGSDDRSTEYTYATGGDLVLPATETIKDDGGTKVAETRWYYDSQALSSVTTGNLTKQEGWVSGSSYVDQTYTYDTYGNVLSETDGEGNTTLFEYDTHNLYVASTTNAAGHNTQFEYDYRTGQVGTTTDANGEVFVTTYDGFGRPTTDTIPDPQTGNSVTKTTWSYVDTPGAVAVAQTNHLTSALSNTSHTYFDGFGQVIQERSQGESAYAVRDFSYGDNGLLETETLPYFSAGSARTTATTSLALTSSYSYDALGRVTAVATVVGTSTTSYDQWTETITDTAGVDKDFEYDAYGRLVTVTEHEGVSTFDTTYEYDSLDNLSLITDALGHERGIAYDGLSRRTSLEDLHDPSDSTFGTWTFAYDDASNLTGQTDPNSQTINWTYDDLNRQLTEDYTGASGTEITYTYDTCTNGVGRLCSAANANVTTTYAYIANGLVASTSKTIDSTTFTSSSQYDRQGNQTELTYPNGAAAQFTYNSAGAVESVDEQPSGGSFASLITDIDYGPYGHETYIERASGITSNYAYDAGELYRLRNIDTGPGTGGPGAELQALEAELFATSVTELPDTTTEPVIEEVEVATTTSTTTEAAEAAEVSSDTEPIASSTASTTESDVIFAVATSTVGTTEPVIELSVAKSTEAVTKQAVEEIKRNERAERLAGQKAQIKLNLENRQQARVLQKYHRERVAGMKALGMEGTEAYEAALYGYDQAELALTEAKHLTQPGEDVSTPAREWATEKARKLGKTLEEFVTPAMAEAYLFDTEDFEGCSTLPCSFDNLSTWGGVTASIDTGSQVSGSNSLQETVTGSGSGALELTNQNEDEVYVQFKVFIPSNMTWGSSGYYSLLRLEDVADGTIFSMALENWGDARLTVNGDVLPWTNTGVNLTKGAVNTVEVRFKKGTTDGAVDIWVNNTTEGSPDYSSGNVNTGTDNVDDIHVGVTYAPEAVSTTYYDDAVIDTLFIGDMSTSSLPGAHTEFVQDISYTYDSVGNITQVEDISDSFTEGTTDYTYDDLNRLTRAIQTLGAAGSFDRTYQYNEIGNITNKHGTAYTYAGLGGGSTPTSITFYDEAIASGLSNWSWDVVIDAADTSPVQTGTYSMELAYPAAWDGLYLHNPSVDLADTDSLDLALNVNSSTGVEFYLYFQDASYNTLTIVPLSGYVSGGFQANTWHDISVPLSALGLTQSYTGAINLVIESGGAATINVDDIAFVGSVGGGGSSATNANPHAATQIGNTTYTYDDNGNLLTSSAGLANTWNYRNELIESGDGQATTTFAYDHTGQRIKKTAPDSTVSYYPFGHYEVRGGEVSTHVYLGDRLAATREDGTITDVHTDHLGSTHTVTNEHARLEQAIAYYPYGETRNEATFATTDNQNRFTGHDYDVETNLNYMKARYQDGETARFLSQDPASLKDPVQFIGDPQQFNTYGYARNNPLAYNDPTGEVPAYVILGGIGAAVGAGSLFTADRITGHRSSGAEYAGAAVGGAVVAATAPKVATRVRNPYAAAAAVGVLGGATSNLTEQTLNGQSFSVDSLVRDTVVGGATGAAFVGAHSAVRAADDMVGSAVPSFSVTGVTAGNGSYQHVFNTTIGRLTGAQPGMNVSYSTLSKMLVAYGLSEGIEDTGVNVVEQATEQASDSDRDNGGVGR